MSWNIAGVDVHWIKEPPRQGYGRSFIFIEENFVFLQ